MRSSKAVVAAVLCWSALAACGPRRIPGTDIHDTADTREIMAAIDAYRGAAERRDARAVLALVSSTYFDDAGTPEPGDDVDHGQLERRLADDYARLAAVRLRITVRSVDVQGEKAFAVVSYDEHYRIATAGGEVPKHASDDHRMELVREGGAWRFASGL